MRLLLDTSTLIWWTLDQADLPTRIRQLILDPDHDKWVSAVSAMEVSTKVRIGKLPDAEELAASFSAVLADQGFYELTLHVRHGELAGRLPGLHKDPFDRMLAAQAILEGLTIVSSDTALDQFGVQRIW